MMKLDQTSLAEFRVPGEAQSLPDQADLQHLTRTLERYTPHDGGFELSSANIQVYRNSKIEGDKTFILSLPSICIVPQGAKSVSFGKDGFEYDESKMVVYAAEIPIQVRVTKASKDKPYFCLVIPIDPHRLGELILKVFPHGVPKSESTRAVYVGDSHPKILKSALRLMDLIEQQEDTDLLVPLVIDEILIRLLRSPVGPSIAQIGITDSHAEKVGKAITWLKDNYTKPIKMDDLSKIAGMSVSAFHTHFKNLTEMSPLQFQKTLRLQEARNLMITKMMDVSSASYEVGYSSPSQFSREYSRFFGHAPSQDIGSILPVSK